MGATRFRWAATRFPKALPGEAAVKTRIALIVTNFMRLQLTLGSIGVNS